MKLFNSFLTLLLPSVIGITTALSSCASKDAESKKSQTTVSPVVVTVANANTKILDGINVSGRLEATELAQISTRVMGNIDKLHVKVGDQVRSGQVLVTINNQDMSAKRAQTEALIAEAEANLHNAQKDYNRFTVLFNQQSASEKELDNVTLQFNAAKARVDAARQMRNEVNAMMNYTTLVAPFTGTIIQKSAEPGTLAQPGMPILTIEKKDSYQVTAAIPETEISKVKLKDKARLYIKSADRTILGSVTEINPSSQLSGGQYIVKISLPEKVYEGLYSGMYVNVFIEGADHPKNIVEKTKVLVPQSAIVYKDQLEGLYTVSNTGTALLRWVRLGKVYGQDVEVLSGLNPSEQFILHAEQKLYNGIPVTIKETR